MIGGMEIHAPLCPFVRGDDGLDSNVDSLVCIIGKREDCVFAIRHHPPGCKGAAAVTLEAPGLHIVGSVAGPEEVQKRAVYRTGTVELNLKIHSVHHGRQISVCRYSELQARDCRRTFREIQAHGRADWNGGFFFIRLPFYRSGFQQSGVYFLDFVRIGTQHTRCESFYREIVGISSVVNMIIA